MKYKFLMMYFKYYVKKAFSEFDYTVSGYSFFYSIKYKFETKSKMTYRVLDRLTDELIIKYDFYNKGKIGDNYKPLINFIKTLTIEDFRILYNFKLFIYQEVTNPEESKSKLHFLNYYHVVTTICGGILYKSLNIDNVRINIGKELDKITDFSKYVNMISSTLCIENLTTKEIFYALTNNSELNDLDSSTINKIVNKALNDVMKQGLVFPFVSYYENLLSLYNVLYIDDIKDAVKDKLSVNHFKFSLRDTIRGLTLADGFNSYLYRNDISDFFKRKYIVPKNGVELEFKHDSSNPVLIKEGIDNLLGYYIITLNETEDSNIFTSMILLNTEVNNISSLPVQISAVLDFYGIRKYEFGDIRGYRSVDLDSFMYALSKDNVSKCDTYILHFKESDYEVRIPYYWKYKGRNIKSKEESKSEQDYMISREIVISPYKRNLPKGHKRSKEADNLARKICIKLEDNETIVSDFTRLQKVNIFK